MWTWVGLGDVPKSEARNYCCSYKAVPEQKARSTYEYLIDLADDPDVIDVLQFLRQREIVHFQRFGEALRTVQEKLAEKKFYMNANLGLGNQNNRNNYNNRRNMSNTLGTRRNDNDSDCLNMGMSNNNDNMGASDCGCMKNMNNNNCGCNR